MKNVRFTRNLVLLISLTCGVWGLLSLMSCDGGGSGSSTGGGGAREFVSGDLNPGNTYTHVFTSAKSVPYYCRYHRSMGMTGVITVGAAGTPNRHNASIASNSNLPDLTIEAGDTVVWTNNTGLIHTVESDN